MQEHTDHISIFKKVTIVSIKEETKDFRTFELEGDIPYEAGQYITLVYAGKYEEVRRSYSFASAPALGEPMRIGIKRIDNGFFSRRLVDSARPGDRLITIGAAGRFTLPKNMEPIKQVFFLAAGSGITPIFSLLKTVLHVHPSVKVVLIYSNASKEIALFLEELEALAQAHQQLKIEFLFSNNFNLSRARLHRELLETFVSDYVSVPFNQALFYICGPESYMRLCSYVLQEAQVPAENIKKENFTIQRIAPPRAQPPDKAAYNVELQMGGEHFTFSAQYPDTILQAAKKAGIGMPYSCELGRCGNCLARCTKGKIWHSYNEVLTDKELEEGLMLTCVAYPVGGDVQLVIE
jgi:ferredoxin-NADP reductase